MATVTIDIIDAVAWDERDGLTRRIQRNAIVSGLTTGHSAPQEAYIALNDYAGGPGSLRAGAPHPLVAGLYIAERRLISAPAPSICVFSIVYLLPANEAADPGSNSVLEVDTVLEQISTAIDRDGTQITVEGPSGEVQGGNVTVYEPRTTERRQTSFQSSDPRAHASAYVGFVNNDAWRGAGSEKKWLCASIRSRLINRETTPQPTWDFSYEFWESTATDGWDPQVIYVDPETGKHPPGLVEGTGYKTVTWYKEAPFIGLGL